MKQSEKKDKLYLYYRIHQQLLQMVEENLTEQGQL